MPFSVRRAAGLCSLVAILACLAALPSHADARKGMLKAMWGPVAQNGVSQFPIYKDLGVNVFEFPLRWANVALRKPTDPQNPNDPAYRWPAELDQAVAEGGANGIQTLIRVSMTPSWANGGKPTIDPPTDPEDYADFMVAVAKRYPSVRMFMVWEEPNRAAVYRLRGIDHHNPTNPLSPRLKVDVRRYAQLVDATYGKLKRLNKANKIIGGNSLSLASIDPKWWIQYLRLPNGKPPRMDYYGHNPLSPRRPDVKNTPFRPTGADISDMPQLEAWIDRYLGRDGRNKKLPVFISEYTQPTSVAGYQFYWHVTLKTQASFLRGAMKIARDDPRVAAFGWYSLRDLPPNDTSGGLGSRVGLIDGKDKRKPAYQVFKNG